MEVRRATHVYRLLKSSWGIRIAITGTASICESQTAQSGAGNLPISLKFSGSALGLCDEHRRELNEGLSVISPGVIERVGFRHVSVDVEEVQFNETDFQAEGLSVAMCRWTEEVFELSPRQIIETFDRSANRYRFVWS